VPGLIERPLDAATASTVDLCEDTANSRTTCENEPPSSSTRSFAYVMLRASLVIGASVCALSHVWLDLARIAMRDEEASHLALVPITFLWLTWVRRDRFRKINSDGQLVGLLLVVAALVIHEIGISSRLIVVWHASAVVALLGGLCLSFGLRYFLLFVPALFSLLFLIPVPGLIRQQLSLPMQLYSAMLTEWFLAGIGMEVVRNGCLMTVNGTQVLVAEACNGMRMFFSVMLVVYTIFFSIPTSRLRKVLMCLLSPLVALLLNTVRLISTVAMYGLADEHSAEVFHDAIGWLIPMSIMLVVIAMTGRSEIMRVSTPGLRERITWTQAPVWNAVFAVILGTIIVFGSWRPPDRLAIEKHHDAVAAAINALPWSIQDWLATDGQVFDAEIELLKPNAAIRRFYRNLEQEQQMMLAMFASTHARDLIGHEPGICFTGQGWIEQSQRDVVWEVDGTQIHGRDYVFQHPTGAVNRRVVSILVTPTGATSGDPRLVAEAASDFRLEPFGALAISLSTDHQPSDEEWQQTTGLFVQQMKEIFATYRRLQIW